ncbi:MAG: cytochrome C [Geobacteraceae bacterium GWC2_58_44]|nr:MAG: cytochrome C [Geobacteraceae bacterium GWC2_58_44]HBG04312.1 cytochrome C [Geobacter sp.]
MKSTLPIVSIILLALLAAGCSEKDAEKQGASVGDRSLQPVNNLTGETLFNERCRECHMVHGKGGAAGPELSQIGSRRSRTYLEQVIREPAKVHPGSAMPLYDTFSVNQVSSLVDYLSTLK